VKRGLPKASAGESVGQTIAQVARVYFNVRRRSQFGIPSENFRQQRRFGRSQSDDSVEAGRRQSNGRQRRRCPEGLDGDAEGISLAVRDNLHALHRVSEVSTHGAHC
jgi:hypothetical protein